MGQPALLTVHLENLTFARHITGLPSAAFDGLRPEFQLSAEPIRETATDHARSFTRTLRPLRAGITRIPAIVIQTFDPDTGEYQTLRSAPIPITVEPEPEDTSRVVAPRMDSEPLIPLNGVRHNRVNEQTMMAFHQLLEFLGRHWWVFVPLPPLLWLALLPARAPLGPLPARSGLCPRHGGPAAIPPERQRRDEEMAWRNYLADRLALCAEALTADTVTQRFAPGRWTPTWSPKPGDVSRKETLPTTGNAPLRRPRSTRNLVRRLHKATIPLLLACSLLVPLRGDAAESADELFARALQMRGEKPDEAQPLFVEAALRFESAERFRNAGNSWFFAGENGRALANYRAAERRWPFDRQLRESIAFLRANRADAFPPPATPTGRIGGFLEPVLHLGDGVASWSVCAGVSGRVARLPDDATGWMAQSAALSGVCCSWQCSCR